MKLSAFAHASLLAVAALALTSCGTSDGGSGPGDTTPPTITSVSPADGADDVGLIERVEIAFSEPMDASTINDRTITVAGRARRGHVSYDAASRTAYVVPETLYVTESAYEIVVSDSITDAAGNALAASPTTSFETGVLDCGHLEDYLEANDEIAEAAAIETDVIYPTLSVCDEDEDFFEFTLAEEAKVTIRCLMRASEGESWLMQFQREDGADYIWRSVGAGQGGTTQLPRTFLPGTYYVRILCQEEPAAYDYILYDFELATSAPCEDDAYEDNDFLDEAPLVTPGTLEDLRGCGHDYDIFAIALEAGQTIAVTYTNEPFEGELNRRFRIQDPSGFVLASSTAWEDELTLEATATESGTHYVSAKYWTEEQAVEYRIVIVVS
jgi:hypothetical protein